MTIWFIIVWLLVCGRTRLLCLSRISNESDRDYVTARSPLGQVLFCHIDNYQMIGYHKINTRYMASRVYIHREETA